MVTRHAAPRQPAGIRERPRISNPEIPGRDYAADVIFVPAVRAPDVRPPELEREGESGPALPHIRLDRTLQFLLGDRLQ